MYIFFFFLIYISSFYDQKAYEKIYLLLIELNCNTNILKYFEMFLIIIHKIEIIYYTTFNIKIVICYNISREIEKKKNLTVYTNDTQLL